MLLVNVSKLPHQHQEIILRIVIKVYSIICFSYFFFYLVILRIAKVHKFGDFHRCGKQYDHSKSCNVALFQVIGDCHSTRIDDEAVAKYREVTDSRDRELFVEFCLHTILYQPSSQRSGTRCIAWAVCRLRLFFNLSFF